MLIVLILSITILFLDYSLVNASINVSQNTNSYMIVIKEGKKYTEITDELKNKYPDIKISDIKEINVLIIESKDESLLNDSKNYINKEFSDLVQAVGANDKVSVDMELGINPQFHNMARKVKQSKSENIYGEWNWDIDKVTGNGKSYDIEEGNHSVKVAIIDSGIDDSHPDLKDNIVGGKIFTPNDNSIKDTFGHGTMVAGVIAANGNLKGVAPKIAITPYKVFEGAECESSWVIKAIMEAANDKMDVINLSLGAYKSVGNPEERAIYFGYLRAVKFANKKGSLIVASSGTEMKGYDISYPNQLALQRGYENDMQFHVPGGLPNVITVSASNKDNKLAFYSNYGKTISIAAPSGDFGPLWESEKIPDIKYMLLVTYPTYFPQSELSSNLGFSKGYEFNVGGTSLAAPKVAATAALIIAEYKEKFGTKPTPEMIKKYLYQGTTPGANGNNHIYFGKGIVNAENSLRDIK